MAKFVLVLTTVPDADTGRLLGKSLVERRLAACSTMSAPSVSFYWWEGKISEDEEYVLMIKTRAALVSELEQAIQELHPYTVPEIIALPILHGSKNYLDWIEAETKGKSE